MGIPNTRKEPIMKTFYSVKYAVWGADGTSVKWFDNKEAAENFYKKHDHVDKPVAHRCSKPETIKEYEDLVAERY